jgi:hypothetical protein
MNSSNSTPFKNNSCKSNERNSKIRRNIAKVENFISGITIYFLSQRIKEARNKITTRVNVELAKVC